MGFGVFFKKSSLYLSSASAFSLPSLHVESIAAVVVVVWILTAVSFLDLFLLIMRSSFLLLWICADCLVSFILQCPCRPEEGIGCPGAGVTDDCKLPHGCWELNQGSLQNSHCSLGLSPLSRPQFDFNNLEITKL